MESGPCHNKLDCARSSVVSVLPVWPANASNSGEPEGSGIALGDGRIIVTADHVLGPAKTTLVRTLSGEVMKAEIVLRDPASDVALLRLEKPINPMQTSENVQVGSRACAIGNGFGLDISLTCGIISATQMSGTGFNRIEDFLQTDAAVNPGMSGGALVNEDGQLVGMLSAIFTKKSDSNIGVNFAVSAALLTRILDDFSQFGRLRRQDSGLLVGPALQRGQTGLSGALVVRIEEDSPEAVSGIQIDDIILFAGNRRIKRAGAYLSALALLEKGDSLVLDILRQGKRQKISVNYD
ncbi:MAG: trypsin-like peptidase domain-containing protein [Rhizobiaceae bacterium]